MAIVVIGGHSRSVGKTSVVAGLIAALPAYHWTALKITQYGHGVCSLNGESCTAPPMTTAGRSRKRKIVPVNPTLRAFWWQARFVPGGCAQSRADWPKQS